MKKISKKLLFFVILSILTISLNAQDTYALVIGLSKYREVTPLQFADKDALAFVEFLNSQKVPEANIKLFLNEQASRVDILDEMSNLSLKMKKNDRFYFYFGGHGDLEAKIGHENSLLLLYNSYKTSYFKGNEFLQLSELRGWFEDMARRSIEVIFIADACHSGGLIGGKEGVSKTQQALLENWNNVTKILSCKADEYSLEGKQWGGGRGLFSYHLVNGLVGRADANKDKRISLGELDNYLKINIIRQASPNIQTPIILGDMKKQLSVENTEGLKKLELLEQKNFALMTEVNTKDNDDKIQKSLLQLDTTIVETYKKFSKALKDKRVNIHDDSLDCALIHYRKLMTYNLPDNLVQMIKRSMGVGLMELELELLKNVRERGARGISKNKKVNMAILNLEEAQIIFGQNHHIYSYLEARKKVLEANQPFDGLRNKNTIDDNLKQGEDNNIKNKDFLLKSLTLEPNMISTYALLSTTYIALGKPDSSIHYQEKVIKLLPNEPSVYISLGLAYAKMRYKDSLGLAAPHPKAIQNIEKAIALAPSLLNLYGTLGEIYLGNFHLDNGEVKDESFKRFYPDALSCYEKLRPRYELPDSSILKLGLNNYSKDKIFDHEINVSPKHRTYYMLLKVYTTLGYLYKLNGDNDKSQIYFSRLKQKVTLSNSFLSYWGAAIEMYYAFGESEDKMYLNIALEYQLEALKLANEALKAIPSLDKPFFTLQYQQLLAGIGATYRGLRKLDEAERYYKESIDFPIMNSSATGKLKLVGGEGMGITEDSSMINYTVPKFIAKIPNGEYHYRIEPCMEMFLLKIEDNKQEDALYWYERAMQVSKRENGNDTMGKPFSKSLKRYKNIDFKKFMEIRAKYFPNAEKVD